MSRNFEKTPGRASYRASPSLALIKYWGKRDNRLNIPATSSLAVTLKGLDTRTTTTLTEGEDRVILDGAQTDPNRYNSIFEEIRRVLDKSCRFSVESANNFPTAAGLASSSSGFAALTCSCVRAAGVELSSESLSAIARIGSASAARSLYAGFVGLEAGAENAVPLFPVDHWPDLKIVVVAVKTGRKPVSSRQAMEATRESSPYYRAWLEDSNSLYRDALDALGGRDIEHLGSLMNLSYMRMFGTMLSASPNILYWLPGSIALIHGCRELRKGGLGAWETMDAGPQVKIVCLEKDLEEILRFVNKMPYDFKILVTAPGDAPSLTEPGRDV